MKMILCVRVFSDAKDEREKSETEVKPGVGPQQSHTVSLQVRLLPKATQVEIFAK